MSEKIILGIDPGTTVMGFGIIKIERNQMYFIQMNELRNLMPSFPCRRESRDLTSWQLCKSF